MRKAFAIGIVLILAFALVSCGTSKGRVYDKATQVFSKLSWWDDDKYTETDVFQNCRYVYKSKDDIQFSFTADYNDGAGETYDALYKGIIVGDVVADEGTDLSTNTRYKSEAYQVNFLLETDQSNYPDNVKFNQQVMAIVIENMYDDGTSVVYIKWDTSLVTYRILIANKDKR